jgi:hypothetical protein
MLLVDLNQVLISAIITHSKENYQLDEDLVTHIALNTLRANIKKFKDYGEVILCCDSRNYWRKAIFPLYKAHRKSNREKSNLDWNLIFKVINKLKEDFKTSFPYKVIEVDGAEADDIIGTLTPRFSSSEKVMILSSDQDFKQLHKYKNVKQYNPMLGIYVKSRNPQKELKEKVIRGDKGDNIPNILSVDNVFELGLRQSAISEKKLQTWLEQSPKDVLTEDQYRNYVRNDTLINFDYIPEDIKLSIINQYEVTKPSPRNNLYKYLVSNRMTTLLSSIEDF